ncbi:MAG: hypothetical protein U0228_21050 [Myxococcaceae bacterium]
MVSGRALLIVALTVVPLAAQAGPSARLLPDELPGAGGGESVTAPAAQGIGFGELFVKTAAVGTAASATGILIGAGLGTLSNNLIGAALPGLLLPTLILSPLITVLAARLMGNWDDADRFGFWIPFAGAFVVNAAAVILTSLVFNVAVGITNPLSLMVFALADGVLMSGATTGLMALTEKKKVSTVRSFAPGVTDTTFVALQEVAF